MSRIRSAVQDRLRMLAWLLVGIALYAMSLAVGPELPVVQTVLYKIGHVTTLAWVGYWISRHALGRLNRCQNASINEVSMRIARAIIIAGVIIAGSLGL